MTDNKLNAVSTCEYNKICPSYEFRKCCLRSHMDSCKNLNQYLQPPPIREEEIDYHTDLGLVARLKR